MAEGLDELATFVRVVDAGSIAGAARLLGVPKSTVSRRISRLEDRLGVRLLQRTTRSMHTTAEGQSLYQRASGPLADLENATSAVADAGDTPRGLLRVTAPVDFGRLFAPIVSDFMRKYPEVSVDIDLTGRKVDLVAEGFDLAVRGGTLEDSSLIARKLAVVELQLFAAPAYLAERGTPKRVADLADHECVLFRPKGETLEWTFAGGKKTEAVEVRGRLRSSEYAFVRSACIAGAGIARMPSHLGQLDVQQGRLVRVLPKRYCNRGGMSLMYPSARHLPAKARAFRDHLVAAFETAAWQLP